MTMSPPQQAAPAVTVLTVTRHGTLAHHVHAEAGAPVRALTAALRSLSPTATLVATVRVNVTGDAATAMPDEPTAAAGTAPARRLVFGDVTLDLLAREVTVGADRVDLTAREYELLAFLATQPRRVFTREELLEQVWGSRYQDPATVTEHIRRIRIKVGQPDRRRLVTTLRGHGYRFDGALDDLPAAG